MVEGGAGGLWIVCHTFVSVSDTGHDHPGHGPSVRGVSLPDVIRTQPTRGGWLEVVCGPMFSGKSEELIRRLRRAEIAGQRALIVKPTIDNRYDVGHVVSHAGAKMRAVTAGSADAGRRLPRGAAAAGTARGRC